MTPIVKASAATKPSTGDNTINATTFSIPIGTIALGPPAINPAPINPPIKAWLLDEGNPKYQVIKFHVMAPMRPERITGIVENSGCKISLPTVAATAVPNKNGPATLATAAIPTAWTGFRTLVPTTVAIEFAES